MISFLAVIGESLLYHVIMIQSLLLCKHGSCFDIDQVHKLQSQRTLSSVAPFPTTAFKVNYKQIKCSQHAAS